jgi:hypothetical protein
MGTITFWDKEKVQRECPESEFLTKFQQTRFFKAMVEGRISPRNALVAFCTATDDEALGWEDINKFDLDHLASFFRDRRTDHAKTQAAAGVAR